MTHSRGFTIIELLVVLAIIGLLVAAASLSFSSAQRTGRDAQRMGDVLAISKAVDRSTIANGGIHPGKYIDAYQAQAIDEVCAHSLTKEGFGVNIQPVSGISVTDFKNGVIPEDPLPQDDSNPNSNISHHSSGGYCAFPNYGYIYQSHYTNATLSREVRCGTISDHTCSMAIQMNVEYLLELSLENQIPSDNQSFLKFKAGDLDGIYSTENLPEDPGHQSGTSSQNRDSKDRSVYYLPGPYCGDNCYTN